jgi:multidrug efflux pump subunit AcrA (membrane-fusion protein)
MSDQTKKDQIMDALSKSKKKRLIIGGIFLVLAAFGILAFIQVQSTGSFQAKATETVKTSEVTVGDLKTEVSGTGSIVAPNAIDLVFSTTGKVDQLNVNPGKSVTEGDVLATLDRISSLELDVQNAKLNLTKAQQTLDDLTANKDITLANALKAKATAASALDLAQKSVVNKYSPRCEKSTTEEYYFDYMYARSSYLYWYNALIKQNTGYGDMYIQERMAPYKKSMNQNFSNWKFCEGYSELEIEKSQANVEKAQATYDKASEYYTTLQKNGGIDPDVLAVAQTDRDNANLQYEEAKRILDGATLTSPIDGTVITVASAVGEILTKDTYNQPFIEIADLSKPVLQANFDESDLASINTGCEVLATFAGLNKQTFSGKITQINPTLTQTDSVNTIGTYISIDNSPLSEKKDLPVGLKATVELNCTIAKNVMQVSQQALKNENNGKATVYVKNADGTIVAHTVNVGIKSLSAAEITGDVKKGDLVITSTVK